MESVFRFNYPFDGAGDVPETQRPLYNLFQKHFKYEIRNHGSKK